MSTIKDQVKKAFRKRSSKAHPDKGGTHEDQAAVNHAYAVLADPMRRARYDQTGNDGAKPSQQQVAHEMVMAAFSEAIEHDAPNLLDAARKQFTNGLANLRAAQKDLDRKEAKLLRRRGKATVKRGQNLLEALLDSKLGQIDQQRAGNTEAQEMLTAAAQLLEGYESTEPDPSSPEFRFAEGMRMVLQPGGFR